MIYQDELNELRKKTVDSGQRMNAVYEAFKSSDPLMAQKALDALMAIKSLHRSLEGIPGAMRPVQESLALGGEQPTLF